MGRKSRNKKIRRGTGDDRSQDVGTQDENTAGDDDFVEEDDVEMNETPPELQLEGYRHHRFNSERMNRAIGRYFERNTPDSIEEANEVLGNLFSGKKVDEIVAASKADGWDDIEEAQELMFQAMEMDVGAEAERLAAQAHALDPVNPDANIWMAFQDAKSVDDLIERLRAARAAAEERFGETFMEENKGQFWGNVFTRPYMRLRDTTLRVLMRDERFEEAIAEAEAMLQLNPDDNQGIRSELLALYLCVGDCAAARRLMKEYKEDSSAIFLWGRVFERILSNNKAGVRNALKKAMQCNKYVLRYLLCVEEMPEKSPEFYKPGDRSEALVCMQTFMDVLNRHDKIMHGIAGAIADEMKRKMKDIEEI